MRDSKRVHISVVVARVQEQLNEPIRRFASKPCLTINRCHRIIIVASVADLGCEYRGTHFLHFFLPPLFLFFFLLFFSSSVCMVENCLRGVGGGGGSAPMYREELAISLL